MSTVIYGADSFDVVVTVDDGASPGSAKSLAGATVAAACRTGSSTPIAATTSVQSAAAGEILVSFAAGDFTGLSGEYECQVRVTLSGKTQTVSSFAFTVKESIIAA